MKAIIALLTVGIIACVAGVFFAPGIDSQNTDELKKQVQAAAEDAASYIEEKAAAAKSQVKAGQESSDKTTNVTPVDTPSNHVKAPPSLEETAEIYTQIIDLIDSQTGSIK